VVLYKDAVDAGFNVQDFDVTLTAGLAPANVPTDGLTVHWEKVSGPDSGQLLPSGLTAVYRNPRQGGVYRFRLTVRKGGKDLSFGEAVLVLPLAAAEMDSVVKDDLVLADAFAARVNAKYGFMARLSFRNQSGWFITWNGGDYAGRPSNEASPAVWYYGQVATGNLTDQNYGLGVVCTWKGRPVRMGKISNFVTAYGVQKLGIPYLIAKVAVQNVITTPDRLTATASKSWDDGWSLAQGGNYDAIVTGLVDYIWRHEVPADKTKQPWPNPNPPDANSYQESTLLESFNYDRNFATPEFLRRTDPVLVPKWEEN
jgi:hypothetical protein